MIIDTNLQLSSAQAITSTATSTNSIDLLNARDAGPGWQVFVNFLVTTSFASSTAAATLNMQIEGAPNNAGSAGTFYLLGETGVISLGQLQAGTIYSIALPTGALAANSAITTTTSSAVSASTSMPVASATGVLTGMYVNGTGVTPGTTVASVSGSTVTLSAAMTIAAGATITFTQPDPLPRFIQANYVASNTMTAGAITAWVGDKPISSTLFYPPGVTVPN